MNKMSSANRQKMMDAMLAGSQTRKGKKREPKDFDAVYKGAMHISEEGWYGIPASALRAAMVDACRLVGFRMTIAKLSVFVDADGIDADDGQPLVRLTVGTPVRKDMAVKLANGSTDILARPFFNPWAAEPTLTWDGDQLLKSGCDQFVEQELAFRLELEREGQIQNLQPAWVGGRSGSRTE